MSEDNLNEMMKTAKESAAMHLDRLQGDLTANESFVLIHGAKVRNSMSPLFISDLNNDKHVKGFLNFLDN